ncbi:MAG: type II toxin-antitoxin system prevent-host-death family antitoxin [Phycisphaerae bacterium]|nr:type II toxin-antitoxin system prevent-host-death family antitoxin [Phycisphaerales bacterium]
MLIVDINEISNHFDALLELVANGKSIIITKAGKPIARLTPINEAPHDRTGGQWKGRVKLHGDFDAPFPENVAAPFGAMTRKGKLP